MSTARLLTALSLTICVSTAFAAPAAPLAIDHSSSTLIDKTTALALWKPALSAKLLKLYPVARWGYVSEVEGGFDDAKVCVVTARAMMLPRSGKTLVFQPNRTATAYGALSGASEDQCRTLARAKLGEAITALSSALVVR
jgi:hypothetical protein